MATLQRAIKIAVEAHADQKRKNGEPYILHPMRVMLSMKTDDERIVAILHDVVEDSPEWDYNKLLEEGFKPDLINAVYLLTRDKDEGYERYIDNIITYYDRNIVSTRLALKVKLADMRDNMNVYDNNHYNPKKMKRYFESLPKIKAALRGMGEF